MVDFEFQLRESIKLQLALLCWCRRKHCNSSFSEKFNLWSFYDTNDDCSCNILELTNKFTNTNTLGLAFIIKFSLSDFFIILGLI